VKDQEDVKFMRNMWLMLSGLFGLFLGLVMVARMVTNAG